MSVSSPLADVRNPASRQTATGSRTISSDTQNLLHRLVSARQMDLTPSTFSNFRRPQPSSTYPAMTRSGHSVKLSRRGICKK